jgi:hypothetical protein
MQNAKGKIGCIQENIAFPKDFILFEIAQSPHLNFSLANWHIFKLAHCRISPPPFSDFQIATLAY